MCGVLLIGSRGWLTNSTHCFHWAECNNATERDCGEATTESWQMKLGIGEGLCQNYDGHFSGLKAIMRQDLGSAQTSCINVRTASGLSGLYPGFHLASMK